MKKSLFISIEGDDFSGKTTAVNTLIPILEEAGIEYVLTREPGGAAIAEQIRAVIVDKKNTEMDPVCEALLYAAARRQHVVEKIVPALKAGKIVISDRFIDSNLAYQGYSRNIGIDKILEINNYAINVDGKKILPDLTIYLDLDPNVGLQRMALNKNREINRLDLEGLEFHKKVREGYQELAKRFADRYVVVDANQTPEKVAEEIKKIISAKIKERR